MHKYSKYPLQKGSKLAELFISLCSEISQEEQSGLSQEIARATQEFDRIKDSPFAPDMKLVMQLADTAQYLLKLYPTAEEQAKRRIIGAIRYFCTPRDLVHDHRPLVGLDDDILIMNHVLETIGIEHRYITLS